ncbi:hypothetical protein MBRA_44500 [Mycobacterium branderi]|uniref:Uncharacterized protein n=1 Tax=Mycobacterium branderi TaxID=43348 RepID=A0ABN6B982_9MYCO|nr:hypothetical protein MBRA_44500 [Mycobacterium branderi]
MRPGAFIAQTSTPSSATANLRRRIGAESPAAVTPTASPLQADTALKLFHTTSCGSNGLPYTSTDSAYNAELPTRYDESA